MLFCFSILFLLIFLIAPFFINKSDVSQDTVFETYEEALNWGKNELGKKAVVVKNIEINNTPNHTNLIFFTTDNFTSLYISRIITDEASFRYARLSPTFSLITENSRSNVAFDVPINVNGKVYYALFGKVDKTHNAYIDEEELELDVNRIFIRINHSEKSQVSFRESIF